MCHKWNLPSGCDLRLQLTIVPKINLSTVVLITNDRKKGEMYLPIAKTMSSINIAWRTPLTPNIDFHTLENKQQTQVNKINAS